MAKSLTGPKDMTLRKLSNWTEALLATCWRFDKELGRMREEIMRGVDEKVLDMRSQIAGVRQRLEAMQKHLLEEQGLHTIGDVHFRNGGKGKKSNGKHE